MKLRMGRSSRPGARQSLWGDDALIRAELFGVERLEQHAETLAAAQRVSTAAKADRSLARRLDANSTALLAAYRSLASVNGNGRPITPAAEWLVDNFHVVEEQVREVQNDLPPGYYRQLPKLEGGPFKGYPRVLGIAWAFVAHTDSRFDGEMLARFVAAYQRVQPLTIGELWAIAITLRVVLVENLRRAAERLVGRRADREAADALADRLIGTALTARSPTRPRPSGPLSAILAPYEGAPLPATFAVQLVQRLRDQDPDTTPALRWLEVRLAAQGTTGEELVRAEHQRQGAMNVTVRNIITSMRRISAVDWPDLVERVSLVDGRLRAGSDFADLDFATRDRYRNAIEDLARHSRHTELEVTSRALAATHETTLEPETDGAAIARREHDPGYYLIAGGRRRFETALGYRPSFGRWLFRLNEASGIGIYLGSVTVMALIVLLLPLLLLGSAGIGAGWLWLFALFGLLPAIDVALAVVNHGAMNRFGAKILPGLELEAGVPADRRTLVAVPTLLTSAAAIAEQVERLEVHHLASHDDNLTFALLSDWTDAATEHAADDAVLRDAAAAGIAALNDRYGPGADGARFFLLHRRRVWNPSEGSWMGWERKRGKLHELNRLLRGATDTTFMRLDGPIPNAIRYVITLDADTRLPRDAARRLVGKMAHPLNRPRFDASLGRVVEGYAVLQPRVTPSLPVGREGSLFQRVFSSTSGIDPYAAASSDLYQDLFGEGSYAGKGIYDIDAFEAALDGRVPENALLSHDLFEGVFARAGLVSDIEVVEEFPSRYDVAASRQHRWVRGDWQLLPWLFGRKAADWPAGRSAIPVIGRWKMLDNLRRSLAAPASVLALLIGWTLPLPAAALWTGFVVFALALPTLLPVIAGCLPHRSPMSTRSRLRATLADLGFAASQTALLVTFLAYQAWLMTDAIGRTFYRLFVSRRSLLEWRTAAQAKISPDLELAGFYRSMAGGIAIAAIAAIVVATLGQAAWPVALPFIVLWLASPRIAQWASVSPPVAGRLRVATADRTALRLIARRTWRYFETFVTADDNHLPPDNFQEDPSPVVARRTSPTNIGLYLLATVAARDFGWLGTVDMVERLEATFRTLRALERCQGHFYNWYATADCRPLDPRYVSAVDSGNLAGHLIALANALREPPAGTAAKAAAGIDDAFTLLRLTHARLREDGQCHCQPLVRLDAALDALAGALHVGPTMPHGEAAAVVDLARTIAEARGDAAGDELLAWAVATARNIASQERDGTADSALDDRLAALSREALAVAHAMDFAFLLDPERKLLAIGYLAAEGSLDPSCYDLLASEARLASLFAIAKGDAPTRHWFRLGRAVTPLGRGAALVSWSGSMFEYLMPSLVMRAPAGSLLEETSRLIVQRQIAYADALGVPWGISESALNARDLEFTYQYSNFGVPGLGLKRGLGANLVIAPYATALATMVQPTAAAANFERLAAAGGLGRYGYYEALDYTPSRLPAGEAVAIVQAYMAHHQGMTVVAIANTLLDGVMRARFHAEPVIQATELLLHERTPRQLAALHARAEEAKPAAVNQVLSPPALRSYVTANQFSPACHLLSNGSYTVMVTSAGAGYSRWQGRAVTRWQEDVTCDAAGAFVYLHDVASGAVWSAGLQPTGVMADSYRVILPEDRAEIIRRDGELTTTLDILVSPEDDAEVRRVSIANSGSATREIEVTSYAEIVLAPPATDAAHPAFAKLFVETSYDADCHALLATRRRRAEGEPEIWAAQLAVVEGETVGEQERETDRAQFLGRGQDLRTALAMQPGQRLSGTVGTVLDPIFAIRRRVRIAPGAVARIAFWTMVAGSRQEVLDLADKHHDPAAFERAAALAWTQAQVQLRHLGIGAGEANLFQRLAGHVLQADPRLRPPSAVIARGAGGQAGLWPHGISGDLPIVLVQIHDAEDGELCRQLLQAHEYWRMKQLAVDLVVLNERAASYVQDLQVALETMVRTSQSHGHSAGSSAEGSVYVLRADLIQPETRALLQATARAVLVSRQGTLEEQLDRLEMRSTVAPPPPAGQAPQAKRPATPKPTMPLEFFNGQGGFALDGREYVTILAPGEWTPAPWANVVANPAFGFLVAAEGGGCSWAVNSRENQLTPWSNDPVSNRPGEAIYLRDEATGELFGPTALPLCDDQSAYIARHGQGYSRFTHTAHGIAMDLLQFVPLDDPIKIGRLQVQNTSGRRRRLSVTAYVEWVQGQSRSAAAPFIITELDPETDALMARNPRNSAFGPRTAFLDLAGLQTASTGDRRAFIGRNGSLARPAALAPGTRLAGRTGAGLDPCGALQAPLVLHPGETAEIVILLGETGTLAEAQALIRHYRTADLDAVFADVARHWDDVLDTVQVTTPDRSMDLVLNRWLLYQALVCRIWARSGFYQASGAYGFRDQLQDGMALAVTRPELTRAHLLRAASRQFPEGDVQHWWLPSSGQGVRTRISDDRIWLAHCVAHYVRVTADATVLDEDLPFLEGPMLSPGEHDAFFQPGITAETASLFEHCARGLDLALEVGERGLPLIGTGDWNDGMNRVGEGGRGESVWLGWFLVATIDAFAPIAEARGDAWRAATWRAHRAALLTALEDAGWDGEWYRRGYFDDGTPLGSASSDECRIDSIAQSWAVLSGAGDPERAARAMAAVDTHLLDRKDGLALLFTPPFDQTNLEPGYIKGYPPGIRENGGQYTHAATWALLAFARLGEGDKAAELFAMLNPINHSKDPKAAARYKVEPYAVAADVYSMPPHVGRGGWTWYTGSAAWLYRAGLEGILGLTVEGATLVLDPCIPKSWPRFEIVYRYGTARYDITVENPNGVCGGIARAILDGRELTARPTRIPLHDDGTVHLVQIQLGKSSPDVARATSRSI